MGPAYRSDRGVSNPVPVWSSGREYSIALIPLNWANGWVFGEKLAPSGLAEVGFKCNNSFDACIGLGDETIVDVASDGVDRRG
jgi:hypothetical protein